MNGWPETPEAGSRPWLLRRNVFESLAVVCRCRVGTVGRVEGRKEGRKGGRKGEREGIEARSGRGNERCCVQSALGRPRSEEGKIRVTEQPKNRRGPTLFTLDFSLLRVYIFLNNLARLINQGLEISSVHVREIRIRFNFPYFVLSTIRETN